MVRCAHLWVIQERVGTFRQTDLSCATVACPNTPLMELKEQIRGTSAQGGGKRRTFMLTCRGNKKSQIFNGWSVCNECCCLLSCWAGSIHTIEEYFTHALCIGLWVGPIFGHHTSRVLALPRQLQGSVPWHTCWTHCNWVSFFVKLWHFWRSFWSNNYNSSQHKHYALLEVW